MQVAGFCLVVTQTGEKSSWTNSHIKITDQGQGYFSEGSRSLSKVAGSESRSVMASSFDCRRCRRVEDAEPCW